MGKTNNTNKEREKKEATKSLLVLCALLFVVLCFVGSTLFSFSFLLAQLFL